MDHPDKVDDRRLQNQVLGCSISTHLSYCVRCADTTCYGVRSYIDAPAANPNLAAGLRHAPVACLKELPDNLHILYFMNRYPRTISIAELLGK
jgi:hypothetical protein